MNDRSGASAIQHFGSAIDPRLICPMVVIEKIDFIPFHAKNNLLTTGRRPQDSQVTAPRLVVPSFFSDDV
jgi:hypothetical protein